MSELTTARRPRRRSFGRWMADIGWKYTVGWLCILFGLAPVLYIISASFDPIGSVASTRLIPPSLTLHNYASLIGGGEYPFVRWYENTFVVGLVVSLAQLACSVLAAYAFSRFRFMGRRAGLLAVLLIQMFPQFLSAIALYTMLGSLGDVAPSVGLDTVGGYCLVLMGGALGNVWLIKGFLDSIPREIDEAARVDGAGHFTIFGRIILPLARPILAVTFLLGFIHMVGEYMLASVFLTSDRSKTLAVGLYGVISGSQSNNLGLFAAGSVLLAIPVVILFLGLQRFVTSGLSAGAVK